MTERRVGKSSVVLILAAVVTVVGVSCGSGSGSGNGAVESGSRYLVLPADTVGLVVGGDPSGGGYGSASLTGDRVGIVAQVGRSDLPSAVGEATAGQPTAVLSNGLRVSYGCGGRVTVAATTADDPTNSTSEQLAGPLMVTAEVDGRVLTVVATPTDTSSCTQPTEVSGPLVDVAASLRWVDQAEFRRLSEEFPAPERRNTPTTG